MNTDRLGVPVFSSARSALVALRADLAQQVLVFETAMGITLGANAPELIGRAMSACIVATLEARPHLTFTMARKLVIAANRSWASDGKWYKWPAHPLSSNDNQ